MSEHTYRLAVDDGKLRLIGPPLEPREKITVEITCSSTGDYVGIHTGWFIICPITGKLIKADPRNNDD